MGYIRGEEKVREGKKKKEWGCKSKRGEGKVRGEEGN